MDYTVEIFKVDRRCKDGEKFVQKIDYQNVSKEDIVKHWKKHCKSNCRYEIFETWVVKKNLMSGVEFKERYDTPYYCSPSSETYWSM